MRVCHGLTGSVLGDMEGRWRRDGWMDEMDRWMDEMDGWMDVEVDWEIGGQRSWR